MSTKCDKCDKPATVHLTEIVAGQKIEKHLCEDCASAEGITVKSNVPITQLLEEFILQTSSSPMAVAAEEMVCDVCGMTFAQFHQKGLLGCPNDYDAFEPAITTILERAQEGATHHVGKVPRRADAAQKKQMALLRLRSQLKAAVGNEDYEQAASLRDQIKQMEAS